MEGGLRAPAKSSIREGIGIREELICTVTIGVATNLSTATSGETMAAGTGKSGYFVWNLVNPYKGSSQRVKALLVPFRALLTTRRGNFGAGSQKGGAFITRTGMKAATYTAFPAAAILTPYTL